MKIEPNMRVLALDPGGTTGWATYSCLIIPGIPAATLYLTQKFDCGHITGARHHQQLEDFLGNQRVQQFIVVCERFDERPGKSFAVNPVALEYIGVVKRWCSENQVKLVMQMPSQAKGFTTDLNLKRLEIWQGKKWKHAMDAYRHLLWYLIHGDIGRRPDLLARGWPNA